jgi:hypothetical protein
VQTGIVEEVGLDGNEFAIRLAGTGVVTGYGLTNTMLWRDAAGSWFVGTGLDCMRPLSHGQRITIGVISAKPVADAPATGPIVVWLECPR